MKSVKEKAEAYDKVLEWATEAHKVCDGMLKEDFEHLFPELKESDDEKMIQYFKDLAPFDKADELYEKYGFSHKDAISWLEKQGEHANFRNKIQIGDKVTRNEDGALVNLSQLKRIAKPAENKGKHNMGISEATKKKLEDNLNKALEKETPESIKNFIDTLEVIDPYKMWVQYASIEAGIKAHAETYSFNIESELFNQLTKEQQKLWRKEIEQACISGGYAGVELISDKRYDKKEPVSGDLEEACQQLAEKARIHKAKTISPFFSQTDYIQGVKDGAKWKEEQMIEEKASMSCALEWYDGFVLNFTEEQLNDVVAKNNINIGDKVKVIVIKED